jgi:sterol desaturase/sphingolipid hydroxylase (fatty acid hydroxylase superfamily)
VHHSDPDLDVTTALRFHVCELGFSAGFRALQIAIIGPSVAAYVAYEAVFQAGVLFQHSNLRLPPTVERALTLVMVTPRMHGIHHSEVERETDSNFSSVLSVWDRLHRSLRLHVPQQTVAIGVPAYRQMGDNGIGALLRAPFRKQPDHWRRPDGTVPTRDTAALGHSPTRLEP